MKHRSLSIILIFVCLTISGQQINHPTNHYRNGDMLEKKQVLVEGFELNRDVNIHRKNYCIGI